MLGLEIYCVARAIDPPLTPAVGQHADDLRVIGVLAKLIKGARWDMLEAIVAIDGLRAEVDQYTSHPDLFEDVGGEVGVKLQNYAHGRWARGLAQSMPPLGLDSFSKKVVGVMKPLLLNEGSVFSNCAKPIRGTRVYKTRGIECGGRDLAGPTPLCRQFLPLARHPNLNKTSNTYYALQKKSTKYYIKTQQDPK